MPKKNSRSPFFSIDLNANLPLETGLSDSELLDVKAEFVWFFNGNSSALTLLTDKNLKFLDILYDKYLAEIKKLIDHYGLDEIISESEYAHGWFRNWKKMEVYTKEQFLEKLKTDESFSCIWADLGVTDSMELRNWGMQIQYDIEDKASVKKQGKDQLASLVNSLISDPENGIHCITLLNPSATDDRLVPLELILCQFSCHRLNYEERIKWFFDNFYETGMEYKILIESMKDQDLEKIKWYDEFISIPKYSLSLHSIHGILTEQNKFEKSIVFSMMMLKTMASIMNMGVDTLRITCPKGPCRSSRKKTTQTYVFSQATPSNGLNVKNTDIVFRQECQPHLES